MKRKPKMLLSIGLPLIAVFVVMGVIIYMLASDGLRESRRIAMAERAANNAAVIDGNLLGKSEAVEAVAMNWVKVCRKARRCRKSFRSWAEVIEVGLNPFSPF